jgi:aromatic ring-opening dioxygenase catalytic subunit (LigB family)
MDWSPPDTWESLKAWLARLIPALPETPAALVVATAHWEADPVRVTASAAPDLVYDYHGFPPETYEITWPAPGAPDLAERVRDLLGDA